MELVRILRISIGVSGRCCHLVLSYGNRSEGLVPELSPDFCATGMTGVQLGPSCFLKPPCESFPADWL